MEFVWTQEKEQDNISIYNGDSKNHPRGWQRVNF
jgi:hypothetical protein